jgi:hypothetical protein
MANSTTFLDANGNTLSFGSVSWGTLRPQDLLTAFVDECNARGIAVSEEASTFRRFTSQMWEILSDDMAEMVDMIINEELIDALSEGLPDGVYFGANEGDGADFGYWADTTED